MRPLSTLVTALVACGVFPFDLPAAVPNVAQLPGQEPATQMSDDPEAVDESTAERRKSVSEDMIRIGIATVIEKGPPGVLRVAVGESFHTGANGNSKDYYFRQLSSAFHGWAESDKALIIELWDRGQKFGEYIEGAYMFGPRYSQPRRCPTASKLGVCRPFSGGAGRPSGSRSPSSPRDSLRPQRPQLAPSLEGTAEGGGHSGFHFGLGLGGGAGGFSCDFCDTERSTGLSGFLYLGTSVNQTSLIGIEGTGWTKSASGTSGRIYSVMGQFTGYVNETSGLFLSGGVGLVGYHGDQDIGTLSANAVGFSGRLGYEANAGGRLALIPYVAYLSTFGKTMLKVDGEDAFKFKVSNFQFGLAVGIQ
jgi:hypothetical protein